MVHSEEPIGSCPMPCPSYAPGHQMHPIHGRHLGLTPWGWRPGIVTAADAAVAWVEYLGDEGTIELWHHRALPVQIGDPVRVHEEYYALDIGGAWHSCELRSGRIGAVPTPDLPELWAAEVPPVVVDLVRGIRLP